MAALKKSLLSIGSNLGNSRKFLSEAVAKIQQVPEIQSVRVSRFRSSQPVGGPAGQDAFLNGAVEITTSLSAEQLLVNTQRIEAELGRTRHSRWDARTIDIDILTFDDLIISSPQLVIPHPRMTLRRFVLEPVCDLAALAVHPETGWRFQQHLDHLLLAGNYALTLNITATSPVKTLVDLSRDETTLVAQSLPVAGSEQELAKNYQVLKQWSASKQFVLCNFAPRECLINQPDLISSVEQFERSILPPRLLVILTDNIHNESRHQCLTKVMPNGITTPWLFLDAFQEKVLTQEDAALATCHL